MRAISLTSASGTGIATGRDMLASGLETGSTGYPLLVTLGKSWWMVALRGALALLLGVLMLGRPYWPLNLLVALFGIYALLDGTWAIVSALRVDRVRFAGWPVLFEGLASVAVGTLALTWPLIPREIVLAIATWGLLTGVMEVIAGFRVPPLGAGRWLLVTGGVFALSERAHPGAAACHDPLARPDHRRLRSDLRNVALGGRAGLPKSVAPGAERMSPRASRTRVDE